MIVFVRISDEYYAPENKHGALKKMLCSDVFQKMGEFWCPCFSFRGV